jgi:hypothetical protein
MFPRSFFAIAKDWQRSSRKSNALMLPVPFRSAIAARDKFSHLRRRIAQRDCQNRFFTDTLKNTIKTGAWGGDPDG